ncbi:hypothetical protein LTR62_001867 [Meristemomyces frigidus]|uniref:peptidyl-tRNA hydrolase n=1 Tax=Meristemomyces frigidus TaxID=1508187 RepID=A0AAN7T7W5_9PEZI|nr:hypothetical protein LTR62_001867 [Meristemomyces frigidus]
MSKRTVKNATAMPREGLAKEAQAQGEVEDEEVAKVASKAQRGKRSRAATVEEEARPEVTTTTEPAIEPVALAKPGRSTSTPMTTARTLPLLVCSIGNPGSTYANTLHSAGHTVLNKLAERLGYGPFHKERELGNGLVNRPAITGSTGDWTLWQSTSYMNESGKGVRAAYTAWSKHIPVGEEGRLVVVYDELEKPLGVVTVRTAQGASAKGHNGLKSIMASVAGNVPFVRIGVGIGRPVSRDSEEVARYVLRKMEGTERAKIEGCVEEIVAKLRVIEKG